MVEDSRFEGPSDGESALKESSRIEVRRCFMNLRYPLWHVTEGRIYSCEFTQNCRAPLWYDKKILLDDCHINGVKALRECDDVTVKNTTADSPEFIWKCRNLNIENLSVEYSEYPFFEVDSAEIKKLKLNGKYSFQYCSNIQIDDSVLNTKDAFWHSKNVTVRDSVINGEYLGWYSENLTLINCSIKGTQPFCYCKNLVLKNCTMENCDLSFERSTVHADINGNIDSIKNPLSGKITAASIGEIIMEETVADKSKTEIILLKNNDAF